MQKLFIKSTSIGLLFTILILNISTLSYGVRPTLDESTSLHNLTVNESTLTVEDLEKSLEINEQFLTTINNKLKAENLDEDSMHALARANLNTYIKEETDPSKKQLFVEMLQMLEKDYKQ